ncbi:hypothetical protein CGMCC3_g17811 [Colletotrichum fructicola]|nr:uncharacterized protein CGMCC3_g17811 [Colletotrichum fructicola]KAE9566014.1 hypothetical protein CGMCC3_g17811 [Colletotrichum fructicola]
MPRSQSQQGGRQTLGTRMLWPKWTIGLKRREGAVAVGCIQGVLQRCERWVAQASGDRTAIKMTAEESALGDIS